MNTSVLPKTTGIVTTGAVDDVLPNPNGSVATVALGAAMVGGVTSAACKGAVAYGFVAPATSVRDRLLFVCLMSFFFLLVFR